MSDSPQTPGDHVRDAETRIRAPRIESELTEALYSHTRSGFFGVAVVAAFMAVVLAAAIGGVWTLAWLAFTSLLLGWRGLVLRAYARRARGSRRNWRGHLVAALAASGLGWGSGATLLMVLGGPAMFGPASFIASGFAAGGAVTMGAVPLAYRWFAVTAAAPVAVTMLGRGDPPSLAIAGMICGFTVVMLGIAGRIGAMARRDIESRLSNQELVSSLRASAADLERSNRDLAREMEARNEAEAQLRLAAKVFESSVEGVTITDARGVIVSVNRAFTEITGYTREEVLGCNPRVLKSGRHDEHFYRRMWDTIVAGDVWRGELWNRRKSGEIYPERLAVRAVRDAGGAVTHYIGVFTDISEHKAAEERIEFMAHHDALTGLPNRVLLADRFGLAAAEARRSGRRVAVVFLDLDHFKSINDTLGHTAGDAFLRMVADRLRGCLRAGDTISRQGGDEFVILLPELAAADAATGVIEKILEALHVPADIAGQSLAASGSVGVSIYPDDGDTFDVLLQQADTAMYQAKSQGRNCHCYFSARMNAAALERMKVQQQLRAALDHGEFVLHYQPQVDLGSGRIIGVEALIRWNSAQLGVVAPGRFIPEAEHSGLIVPIGEWVLGEACRQAAAWRAAGVPALSVAVNISALQFARGDLAATVEAALARSAMPAELLELELTESILMGESSVIDRTLQRLGALGVRFAIDDFGTGYSSLAYLKRFHVDRLKIDRSFIHDATNDADDAAIVRAVIQMARSLKLNIIAEGVETDEQARFLMREGCQAAQGYLFSRPLPAGDLEALLAAGRVPAERLAATV